MKSRLTLRTLALPAMLFSTLVYQPATSSAQGSAFTYQGRLSDSAVPANGSYDLTFTIYGAVSGGGALAGPLTNTAVVVSSGLFAVPLDFGSVFDGNARWLEIGARTNGGGTFVTLSPRQPLTPTPYAITAGHVTPGGGLAGTYSGALTLNNPANSFTGAFTGNGAGLGNVNASALGGVGASGFWKTGGNTGTVAGLNFLGSADLQPLELKVFGQRALRLEPTSDTPNLIGGHSGNQVAAGLVGATIGGGGTVIPYNGQAQPNLVTNSGHFGTIAGGYNNQVRGYGGAILGGSLNVAGGDFATTGGGQNNTIETNTGFATIGGGALNSIGTGSGYSTIGGGTLNLIRQNAFSSTIAGGYQNGIGTNSFNSMVAGGYTNVIQNDAPDSTISGGLVNSIGAGSASSTIAGGGFNLVQTNAPDSAIGGGRNNSVSGAQATVAGGANNTVFADGSTVAGGLLNSVGTGSSYSTITGGHQNEIGTNSYNSVVAGGYTNVIGNDAWDSTIGGGVFNTVRAGAWGASISGGTFNSVSGFLGTVLGGYLNDATGDFAVAAGQRAKALHSGTFIWADSTGSDFSSTAANQFNVRALGGVRFVTSGAGLTLDGRPVLAGTVPPSGLSGAYSSALTFNNPANSFSGTFSGNGASVTNVNAATLGGLTATKFWQVGGNAGANPTNGATLGTTDNLPLEFRVNGLRALRLENNGDSVTDSDTIPDGAPNLIGGSAQNFVAAGVVGAAIGGGGATNYYGLSYTNGVLSDFGVVAGGRGNRIETNSWYSTIAGGADNSITMNYGGQIGGGIGNLISGDPGVLQNCSTIAGGIRNSTDSHNTAIGGGHQNMITGGSFISTIAGGQDNQITSACSASTIGGGFLNSIRNGSEYAIIAAGRNNEIVASASYSVIGGGFLNSVISGGAYATIPGGSGNLAGSHAFAAGRRAKAYHTGSFVWADSTDADFLSTADNQFSIRASGGVFVDGKLGVGNSAPVWPLEVRASQAVGRFSTTDNTFGAVLILENKGASPAYLGAINFDNAPGTVPGQIAYLTTDQMAFRVGGQERMNLSAAGLTVNGALVSSSDRNTKENIAAVSPREILDKVVSLPISQWNYKDDPAAPHLGPMAQDFHAAFGVGPDDKHIATVDADGVALAAIQGLNQKVEEQRAELKGKQAEIDDLKQRLVRLEKLMSEANDH